MHGTTAYGHMASTDYERVRRGIEIRRAPAGEGRAAANRAVIDGADGGGASKVAAQGKLTAAVSAPRGTKVTVEGGGMFKRTEMTRTSPVVEMMAQR